MALYGGIGFARFYKRCRELEENQTAILTDLSRMPEAAGQLEAQYQEIIEQLYSRMRELESAGRISRQEMLDYYGMWVHQIKTPIAALKVMLQSLEEERADLPYVREMKLELFKVEQYVEMVLSYLRMEDMSGDLVFEEYSLDAIVRQAVRKYSRMFILKKIRLDLGPLDHQVLTDEKWLVFVVEQILSNALKYTKEGGISIYMTSYRDRPVLAIEDTGIGISAEDLPRCLKRDLPGITEEPTKSLRGSGCIYAKRSWTGSIITFTLSRRKDREQKCTCIWNVNRDSYRNVRMNREMSSKSMEGHFSFFYNRRRKQNIEERTGKQMTLLEVQNVKKIYTTRFGGNQVEALRNVNFSVEQREYVAIMGESGSGKTTLLNILAALDRPTGGKVYLKGRDLSGVKEREMAAFRRQNLGFVFQDFNLLDTFSIEDNILLPLVLSGRKYKEMEKRLTPVVEKLRIADILQKYPYEVSGGQKQRAAVARALITRPQLILADEPTGALDSRAADALLQLFEEINRDGQTILMVTHSVKAASTAKRVLFIKDGEVFHQLYRGNLTNEQMYQKISDTLTVLTTGGDAR